MLVTEVYIVFKKIIVKSWFDDSTLVEFKGEFYSALANYHEYLTHIYGSDYMELPSVEKRFGHDLKL